MDQTAVLVSLYHPFPRTLSLSLPSSSPLSSLSSLLATFCPPSQQLLQYSTGATLPSSTFPISSLNGASKGQGGVFLRLGVKMRGGKGGFASQLRAQGGRMSSNKAQNTDSCRGLDGRRLSTIKEAQRLAKLLESEPDRQAAAAKQAEAKLEQLNNEIKQLERAAGVESSSSGPVASGSGEASGSAGGSGTKRRLDDTKYVEESREIVSGVKDAVRAAMLKKRKKAKAASTEEPSTPSTSTSAPATEEKEKENAAPEVAVEGSETVIEEKEGELDAEEEAVSVKGKGKGKATATKGKGQAKA